MSSPIFTSFLAIVEEFETSMFFTNQLQFFFHWDADVVLFHITVYIVRNAIN